MKKMSETILFFGSGPVAALSLQLLAENFTIEAVVTKPKPAAHHGDVPVLTKAHELGIKVFMPVSKKELSELFATKPVTSRVGVVIDYGIIIAQDVIDYFEKGILNSHFSLLPQWRGADPLSFSILSGQKKTGVSIMLITAGLDEGPLLGQTSYDIQPGETTESLTLQLIHQSNGALERILPLWLAGKTSAAPQAKVTQAESPEPTYSRKLTKKDGLIDWTKPAVQIEREIRAYASWPKSYTKFNDLEVTITAAKVLEQKNNIGRVIVENKQLIVGCSESSLLIEKLKPAGKPEMGAIGFINGYKKYL